MRFFSINKNQLAVISTMMVVVFLGACYLFIYIPKNEERIQEQRFRSLQNIEDNIHKKLDNSIVLMNNLLNYSLQKSALDTVNKFIKAYPKKHFLLSAIQPDSEAKKIDSSTTLKLGQDSLLTIKIDSLTNQIRIFLSRRENGTENAFQIKLAYSLEQFIKLLLPEDVFDEYVIFHNGKLAYQTFPSGLSHVNRDSLVKNKNGISSPIVKNIIASGKAYRFFSQPVRLSQKDDFIVGGLLANERYSDEKNQLPTNLVLLLMTLGLAIFLSLPLIKLYQMGSQDRLTIYNGMSIILVSMLLMSLLFFAFVKYNALLKPSDGPSKQILAQQIIKNFD